MLLRQQEREPEPDRVAPPPNQRPAMLPVPQYLFNDRVLFDDPIRYANGIIQHFFDDHIDDVPQQRGRNQADFDWMREPGQCNLTLYWIMADSK